MLTATVYSGMQNLVIFYGEQHSLGVYTTAVLPALHPSSNVRVYRVGSARLLAGHIKWWWTAGRRLRDKGMTPTAP